MFSRIKKEIAYTAAVLYTKNLNSATGGSMCVREGGYIVTTPHAHVARAVGRTEGMELRPEDLVVIDIKTEKVVEGKGKPSNCTPWYLMILREFPEVKAIIHAHSPYLSYFSTVPEDVPAISSLAKHFVGDIPVAKIDVSDLPADANFGHPKWDERTKKAVLATINRRREELKEHGLAFNMHNHPVWAIGKSISEAFVTLEAAEEAAKIYMWTKLLRR